MCAGSEQKRSKPLIINDLPQITVSKLAGVTRNVVVRNSLTGEQEIRPINEIASSHMARRTFVGNIYKKFKDQSLVSELSGHAPNSGAFALYREVDEEMKREMVSAID